LCFLSLAFTSTSTLIMSDGCLVLQQQKQKVQRRHYKNLQFEILLATFQSSFRLRKLILKCLYSILQYSSENIKGWFCRIVPLKLHKHPTTWLHKKWNSFHVGITSDKDCLLHLKAKYFLTRLYTRVLLSDYECRWLFGNIQHEGYVIKTNLMHYLSSVYFVNQLRHVSGIILAHHQKVFCTYTKIGMCCAF